MNLKKGLVFCIYTMFFAVNSFAEVNSPIKACDPKINSQWTYKVTPVTAPDSPKLPYKCEGKVKVFELTAQEIFSNLDNNWEAGSVYTWGYNGTNPGPVIEILEGETIKVKFKNELPEPTTVHWHGFELPFNMDGASGHSQKPVMPGKTYDYTWTVDQAGTYMYHSGHGLAKQLALGLSGFFVVHPKKKPDTLVDRDMLLFLQMWTLPPHSILPATMDMMFNYFTINGRAAPLTSPLEVFTGEKVRIRFANISMMQHPIHIHGHTWRLVATGAGDNPASSHTLGNTILVPVGQTMDVIIDEIHEEGDWNFHCHLPHHVTNNMEIDPVPGEPMMMGDAGMYTLFKVRKNPSSHGPTPIGHNHDHSNHNGSNNVGDQGNDNSHMHMMAMGPKTGIYKGEIELENKRNFSIVFDIHKVQEEGEWRKIIANLKIDFANSDEYLVYHYDDIRFNWKTGELFFDEEKKGITLNSLKFMKHGDMEMLHGKVKIDYHGIEGKVSLTYKGKDFVFSNPSFKKNITESLEGEYFGSCLENKKILKIQTARGLNETLMQEGNPYFQYKIQGVIAKNQEKASVEKIIEGGTFSPFSGELILKTNTAGVIENLNCKKEFINKASFINCGECSFQKKSPQSKLEEVKSYSFKDIDGVKVSQMSTEKKLAGIFEGQLLHNSLGKSQKVKLNVTSRKYSKKPMELAFPYVAATFHIQMNDKEIVYKFEERPWLDSTSKHSKKLNSLTFKGDEGAYLVVNKWNEDSLSGWFYHKDFGRVGPFSVARNNSQKVVSFESEIAPKIENIGGLFQNDTFNLSINISEIDNEELEIGNPFYPLHLTGKLVNKTTKKIINITSGNFNFFTNTINLYTEDERLVTGKFNKDGKLMISVPSLNKRRARYQSSNILTFEKL